MRLAREAYASRVATRGFALLIAFTMAAQGALPLLPGWQCASMGRRVGNDCCLRLEAQKGDQNSDPATRIAAPCCDPVSAPTLDARAGTDSTSSRPLAPAQIGTIAFSGADDHSPSAGLLALQALPHGAPPGGRFQILNSILRI